MQSIDPNIPGNPFCSPSTSKRAVSTSLGDLRYSSSKISTTIATNLRRLSSTVLSPMRTYLSLRKMGDYKTTRSLDCCALDQIWSSTQRLEDLDWFGPEMPYVQYGGGVLALLLSSPGSQSSEGSLQAGLVVLNPRESNPFLRGGPSLL